MLRRILIAIFLIISTLSARSNCGTGIVPTPDIVSISVDPNGDIVVCWDIAFDPDLAGFNIWTVDLTGANQQIAGPLPPGTSCYTIPGATNASGAQVVQVLVEAFDNCPLPGPYSSGVIPGNYYSTMYLDGDLEPCTSSISLNWNDNDFFFNPRYEIFAILNGGAAISQGTTFSTNFVYSGITAGDSVNFYIVAYDNGGLGPATSTSNIDTPNVDGVLIPPTFNIINNATVVDSQQVDIQFAVDTAADVTSYEIQRSTSETGPFVTIDSVDKFIGMSTVINYSDTTGLRTDSNFYFYRIEIVNTDCGFDGNYSNLASTILIDAIANPVEATNTIKMTAYKYWDLGVLRYDIYRAIEGVWELAPITSLPAFIDSTTYVDDISEVFDGNGDFCYQVVAVKKGGFPVVESKSNEVCVQHEPIIHVPNAFAPNGLYNKEFKPVLTFVDAQSYSFMVFNRWGEIVFQTQEITEAWNGRFENTGNMNSTGVYLYMIKFKSAAGDDFTKRGKVTIVN